MDKKKLLHITASLKMGGAERFLTQLVKGLSADFDQSVVTFRSGQFVKQIQDCGVSVYVVQGWLFQYDPVFFARFLYRVYTLKPDCIHSVLWISNVLSRCTSWLLRIPVVCGFHSPLNSNSGTSSMRTHCDRFLHSWADHYVAISEQIKQSYSVSSNISLIENCVDCQFEKNKRKNEFVGKFVVGSVGRFVSIKNQKMLLDLVAAVQYSIPNVYLLLIGEGSLREELCSHAGNLGISDRVEIHSGDSLDYYHVFDLFILPSFAEGLSIALLEAMSAWVPVVTTYQRAKAHDVIVDGESGRLFDPYNLDMLVNIVNDLFHDEKKRDRFAQSAYGLIQRRFSYKDMVKKYSDLFEKMCKK